MSDEVIVDIEGSRFEGWQGVTITEAIDQVADAFSIMSPFDPTREDMRLKFKPFSYRKAKIYIGSDSVLTGLVESVSPKEDAGNRSLSVQGRSLAGPMLDCDIDDEGYEYSGLALSTIAKKLSRRFGVTILARNDTNPIAEASASVGDTPAGYIQKLSEGFGLNVWSDEQGRLIIGYPPRATAPVASIRSGEFPYLSGSATYDGTKRFSRYRIVGSDFGQPDITGEALDAGIVPYRPKIEKLNDKSPTEPSTTAKRARALGLAQGTGATIEVEGWRDASGAIWRKGTTISLYAPGIMVRQTTAYIIAGLTRKMDESAGRKTTLSLVLPQAYQNEMPSRYPWD